MVKRSIMCIEKRKTEIFCYTNAFDCMFCIVLLRNPNCCPHISYANLQETYGGL